MSQSAIAINDIAKAVPGAASLVSRRSQTVLLSGKLLMYSGTHADCSKAGCAMGNTPRIQVLAEQEHGVAFSKKRKFPSISLPRIKHNFLGLIFDPRLTWAPHINIKSKAMKGSCGFLLACHGELTAKRSCGFHEYLFEFLWRVSV